MSETDGDIGILQTDPVTPTHHDEEDRLKPEFVAEVIAAVDEGQVARARALVEPLHPADIADLLELAPSEQRQPLASALVGLIDGDVLAEMNDWVRDEVLEALSAQQVADFASELDTDDAVAIIEDMDVEDQREVLHAMEPEDRAAIEEALSYPEESAGRLMQRDLIAVPEHWCVRDVIAYLRGNDDLTTDFWEIFVVDIAHKPVGTCKVSWVMRAPDDAPIAAVMQREQTLIPADMDQEEVALRFQKYALISAAVIDRTGRLVGMVTVDDVVHIIQEEAGEDVLLLSGAGEGDINEPVVDSYKARVRWLITNLATATVAATIIYLFQGTLERMVVLAALMPIVAGVGGNAGTQTLAVTVRALATNQLTRSNSVRAVRRELAVALLNGVTIAAIIGVVVGTAFHNLDLGFVIGTAMMANIFIAGLAGVFVPLTLERFKADPAVASSIFVTMITDSMGFLAFLGLATATGLTR
ncbi:magnesium transporter [uncultured Sphingomonas sp.]|uniref:magnesium transporter n=1 Tax=uncultured Sphingomonas sp. TaxID=158754 RepID=UPI0025F814C0|nr:magnesium transporter [uncultured Sphingomonas sp.]